jgi:hypothetical protein
VRPLSQHSACQNYNFQTLCRLLDVIVGGWTTGVIVEFNTGAPVQLTGGGNTFTNPTSGVKA